MLEKYFPFLFHINIFAGVATVIVGAIFLKIILAILKAALKTGGLEESLRQVISSLVETVLWFGLIVMVISAIGFTKVAQIIGLLGGAFAVAIGLGAQYFISNVIAGLSLATDKDFKVGYKVKVGEAEGIIKKMDYRKVRLEDEAGKIHVFPNKFVEENQWIVVSKDNKEGS